MGKPKTARKKPLGKKTSSKRKSDKKNKPPKKHTRRLAGVIPGLGLIGYGSTVTLKQPPPGGISPRREGSKNSWRDVESERQQLEMQQQVQQQVEQKSGNILAKRRARAARARVMAMARNEEVRQAAMQVAERQARREEEMRRRLQGERNNPSKGGITHKTGIKKKRKPKKNRKSKKKRKSNKKKRKSKKNRKSRKKRRSRTARGKNSKIYTDRSIRGPKKRNKTTWKKVKNFFTNRDVTINPSETGEDSEQVDPEAIHIDMIDNPIN